MHYCKICGPSQQVGRDGAGDSSYRGSDFTSLVRHLSKRPILLMLFSVSSLSIFDDVSDEEYLVLIYLPERRKLQDCSSEDIESA